jgi:hypothetical protein
MMNFSKKRKEKKTISFLILKGAERKKKRT